MSLTKAGTIVRIDSRKGATMNLNLSDWDWLNAALGVLFLYRGIRDLYNGTGTGWSTEDEKKHFRKFYGIASILCGALYLVNTFLPRVEPLHSILMVAALVLCAALLISYLCYTLSRDDKNKKWEVAMEVICAILTALFGIGFGIFMALHPEDAIALRSRRRYTQVPEPTEEYIKLTRLEGIVVSVLCAVLLVVLLFAPQ